MNCNYCKGLCIRKGVYKNSQKYQCKSCRKYQHNKYLQKAYSEVDEHKIRAFNNEGIGINSISRIMQIPKSSVLMLLVRVARKIVKPVFKDRQESYEVDELYTYIGRKAQPCYVIYAINRRTKQEIDFVIGARSKENIKMIIESLIQLSPRKIYTDGLPVYSSLIPQSLHGRRQFATNRIERNNLTLRTHLKRLFRKTICYSKSATILEACFRLYVWKVIQN